MEDQRPADEDQQPMNVDENGPNPELQPENDNDNGNEQQQQQQQREQDVRDLQEPPPGRVQVANQPRRHLWLAQNPQLVQQVHQRRQMWLREQRQRQHWAQQVQRWQQHREHEDDSVQDQGVPYNDQLQLNQHQLIQQLQQRQEDAEELDENGHPLPKLRSRHNRHSSFVRFVNTVGINISVYWIDYQGSKVLYKILGRGDYIDINTFVTHPWVFIDEETQMRFPANDQYVYFPEPWFAKYRDRPRTELPARIERTHVYIKRPMLTLRELSLWAISHRLHRDQDAFQLELPHVLQRELAEVCPRKLEDLAH